MSFWGTCGSTHGTVLKALWSCYVTKATPVIFSMSTLSSKPTATDRVVNSLKELRTSGSNQHLSKNEIRFSFHRTCISSAKHFSANYTLLIFRTRMNRFLNIMAIFVSESNVWRMKNSVVQKLQHIVQFQFQNNLILQRILHSSAKWTLVTWCHLFLMSWRTLLCRKKEMKKKLEVVETTVGSKLALLVQVVIQCRIRRNYFEEDCLEHHTDNVSTIFMKMQKKSTKPFARDVFERYCNTIPVFGFSSAK